MCVVKNKSKSDFIFRINDEVFSSKVFMSELIDIRERENSK